MMQNHLECRHYPTGTLLPPKNGKKKGYKEDIRRTTLNREKKSAKNKDLTEVHKRSVLVVCILSVGVIQSSTP